MKALRKFLVSIYKKSILNNDPLIRGLRGRQRWIKKDLNLKLETIGQIPSLSSEQLEELHVFWMKYLKSSSIKSLDDRWFAFYNSLASFTPPLKYYVPDEFWYCYIDQKLTNPVKSRCFDDKNLYDLFFAGVRQPITIARRMNNLYLSADYQLMEEEEVLALCKNKQEVVIKVATESEGGHGVFFTAGNQVNSVFGQISSDFIIQEVLQQNEQLAKINPTSINTIRIMSLIINEQVVIVSSVLRMGINGSRVDNASSGGIVCGILENGRLKDFAYDTLGRLYKEHPYSGRFEKNVVPSFDKCKALVKSLAPRLSNTSKLVSWDLSVDVGGNPILIEANFSFGEIDFHQMCNGPIFGDNTEKILNELI